MKFLYKFFYGRNGYDTIAVSSLGAALLLLIIARITDIWYISAVSLAFVAYTFFRVMSRNISRRRAENDKFKSFFKPLAAFFTLQRNRFRDRKTHVYFHCPNCKNVLRVPRGKGELTVTCPVCHEKTDKKT